LIPFKSEPSLFSTISVNQPSTCFPWYSSTSLSPFPDSYTLVYGEPSLLCFFFSEKGISVFGLFQGFILKQFSFEARLPSPHLQIRCSYILRDLVCLNLALKVLLLLCTSEIGSMPFSSSLLILF